MAKEADDDRVNEGGGRSVNNSAKWTAMQRFLWALHQVSGRVPRTFFESKLLSTLWLVIIVSLLLCIKSTTNSKCILARAKQCLYKTEVGEARARAAAVPQTVNGAFPPTADDGITRGKERSPLL